MTVTEQRSLPAEVTAVPDREQPLAADSAVFDTTELRWFFSGSLPRDIGEWFGASTGVLEQRCDTYLVDGPVSGRSDIGLKRRFGETLELKIRLSVDETVQLGDGLPGDGLPGDGLPGDGLPGDGLPGDGLRGAPEGWRRWSPVEARAAERLVPPGAADRWIDVDKSIVKRRFTGDGTEIAFAFGAPATGIGCDVEVARISVGTRPWWTLAFAAFGPLDTRHESLRAAWNGLVAISGRPPSFAACDRRAMGYPEWLALIASNDQTTPLVSRSLLASR